MKIVTLEDNIGAFDGANMQLSRSVRSSTTDAAAPRRIYALQRSRCGCGSCARCKSESQWGGTQGAAMPTINIDISPTITSNGGSVTHGSVTATSQPQPIVHTAQAQATPPPYVPVAYPVQAQPERIVERPVFVDRVHEVVNRVTEPVYVPVREIVERVKQLPMFMPVKAIRNVDRTVPVPVKYNQPVDRPIPTPVKVVTPVDRPVVIPVNPQEKPRTVRPPQPYQVVTNKKTPETGVNYFS